MSRPSSSSQSPRISPEAATLDQNGSPAAVRLLSRPSQPASEGNESSSSRAPGPSEESSSTATETALRELRICEPTGVVEDETTPAGTSASIQQQQPSPSLDETLSDALRSPRDRPFLLRQEQDMIDFVSDASRDSHVLPLMNSYQRLLVHRCADYYLLHRDVDAETKVVTLSKTPETCLPSVRLPQLFAQIQNALRPEDISPFALLSGPSSGSASPSIAASRSSTSSPALGSTSHVTGAPNLPPAGFRIMRRDPSLSTGTGLNNATLSYGHAAASSTGDSSETGKKSRREMTIEEREAAYREARQRIFGVAKDDGSSSGAESSKDESQKPKEKARDRRSQSSARAAAPDENGTMAGDRRVLPLADPAGGLGYYNSSQQLPSAQWNMPTGSQQPVQAQHTPTAANLTPLLSAGAPVFDPTRSHSSRNTEQPGHPWLSAQQIQGQGQQGPAPSNFWMQGQYNPQQFRLYPQQSQTHPQQGLYPLAAWQQGQLGQGPPSNGSTSNLSSIDAFSPFPPTPSTNSSVGAPSPAPSISGSSTSAAGRDEEPRSSSSNRASLQSFQPPQGFSAGAGPSSAGPRNLQQTGPQTHHSPSRPASSPFHAVDASPHATYPPSNHDSPGPAPGSSRTNRPQPDGRRVLQAGGSTGRLNVGDRTLFDPNGGASSSPKTGTGSSRASGSGGGGNRPGRPLPRSHGSGSAEADVSLAKTDQPPLPAEPHPSDFAGHLAAVFLPSAPSSQPLPYPHWPDPGLGLQQQHPYQHHFNGGTAGAPLLQPAMGVPSIRFPGQQPQYHPSMMMQPQPQPHMANLANGGLLPTAGPSYPTAIPGSSPSHIMGSTLRLGPMVPAVPMSAPPAPSPKAVNNSVKSTSSADRASPASRALEIRPPSSSTSTSPAPKAETEATASAGTGHAKDAHTSTKIAASTSNLPPPNIPGLPARPDWVLRPSHAHNSAPSPSQTKSQATSIEAPSSPLPPTEAESRPPPALQAPTDRSDRSMIVGNAAGPTEPFPIYVSGPVQRGFGRGGKDLGCPTANLPSRLLRIASETPAAASALADAPTGVYFGWARIFSEVQCGRGNENEDKVEVGSVEDNNAAGSGGDNAAEDAERPREPAQAERTPLSETDGQVHPMVMSLGWNPFFAKKTKTAEVHLLHRFATDFYGLEMRVVVLGYIRPEYDYVSADALKEDIGIDKQVTMASLQREAYQQYSQHAWLLESRKEVAQAEVGSSVVAPAQGSENSEARS